jgi:hypothetical protein
MDFDRIKIIQEIQKTFSEWLRFAEAKNATLLTANIAIGVGVATRWTALMDSGAWIIWFVFCFLLLIYTSAAVCVFSFMPQVLMHKVVRKARGNLEATDNLLYFRHAQKYGAEEWLKRLFESQDFTNSERYAAQQIIVIARIASDKFDAFDVAVLFSSAAFVMPILWGLAAAVSQFVRG